MWSLLFWFSSQCCTNSAARNRHLPFNKSLTDQQLGALPAQESAGQATLKLKSGSYYLPHPDKVKTGGEDAHFICEEKQVLGIADGVGGWAKLGIDAGEYARELMYNSVSSIKNENEPTASIDPLKVLEKAHASTKAQGSSTACIIALNDQGILAINVGDSGFIVIRDGSTVFQSPTQLHVFNFPYQLGSGSGADYLTSGQVFEFAVKLGDVIVAGTDGLFDNLYNNEISGLVVEAMGADLDPRATAQKIAILAQERGLDESRQTPFSNSAQQAGFRYNGGKLDDITVLVSYVVTDTHTHEL